MFTIYYKIFPISMGDNKYAKLKPIKLSGDLRRSLDFDMSRWYSCGILISALRNSIKRPGFPWIGMFFADLVTSAVCGSLARRTSRSKPHSALWGVGLKLA
jgi:hypothetical protein